MGLELGQVVPQLERVTQRLAQGRREQEEHLRVALSLMPGLDPAVLRERAARGKLTWLLPLPGQPVSRAYASAPFPQEYVVLASDGSHIDVDPHSSLPCYLINLGTVLLRYGTAPEARLESQARLYSEPGELAISDPSGLREEPLEGPLLATRRTLEEMRVLAELARQGPPLPTLALLDGSLILWGLAGQGYPDFVKEALLGGELKPVLDAFQELGQRTPFTLASYISSPRSTEVVNLLRLALCPYEPPNCDRFCSGKGLGQRPCDQVSGLSDQHLFRALLAPGERSACFQSVSSVVRRYYGRQQIFFFYLCLEEELARVEVPAWVAENEGLLSLAHSLLLEQCRLGRGYPVALAEAHEKAVLTAQDRESFGQLVQASREEGGLQALGSAKSQSKRMRWL